MRTQDEIAERYRAVESTDVFGFQREVLIESMDFEHAQPYLKPEVTAEQWVGARLTDGEVLKAAGEYMEFAWGKVIDHRGISAERSVQKITEHAWLLGRDDVMIAIVKAPHAQYGAPKLKVACEAFGWPIPDDDAIRRMIDGEPCRPGCDEGCGL